ncbi:uncharacterized protein LOC123315870 [Coccinella septempunctata]|uniref:uncharacterized protein LOC123315870 n=1 Tax=Coccinella septempunctata TaxID=41139 RepID=UPI001D068E6A|nr:uncharacterized protein LOC123315870 [Coccinella septempunctata]
MVDVIGIFNNVVNYLSSVGSKLGDVFGKVANCITSITWSDLWSSPKTSLNDTIKGIIEEFKKLWNTIMGLIFGSSNDDDDDDNKKKDTESKKKRRRRHVLE